MTSTGPVPGSRTLARPFSLVCSSLLTLTVVTAGGSALAQAPPSLVMTKTGALDSGPDGIANPGDLINYTIELVNQDVECDVTDLTVSDPLISPITCPSGNPIPLLAVGLSETCTGSYAITQADIDLGLFDNLAEASGALCQELTVQASDSHSEPIQQVGGIVLTKTGILEDGGDGVANPGDLINYSLTATNTGNVTLSGVTFTDSVLATFTCPSGHPIPTLAPGALETCAGTYAITQADIDAGFKENTADVAADEPLTQPAEAAGSRVVTAQATARVTITQQPSLQMTKTGTADLGADGFADPGDLVNYSLVVTNPGNVTLTDVAVSDPLVTPVTCPAGNPIPTMAPMASETCTGSYTLTAADVTAGSVVNSASASGMDPMTQAVSAADTDTVPLPAAVPTTGAVALTALVLALVAAAALALRRRSATG